MGPTGGKIDPVVKFFYFRRYDRKGDPVIPGSECCVTEFCFWHL